MSPSALLSLLRQKGHRIPVAFFFNTSEKVFATV